MQTHSENLTEPLNISKDLSVKNILAKDHQKDLCRILQAPQEFLIGGFYQGVRQG